MKLVFTSKARRDLQQIADRIALDNPARAFTFVEELGTRCVNLVDFPLAYPVIRTRANRQIRRLVHDGYLILYTVETSRITILHILSGRMDIDTLLGL